MLGNQNILLLLSGSRLVLGGLLGRAPSGQFGLYAYGAGIGGASVFYSHDVAFIGDQSQLKEDQEATRILCPNNTLYVNPEPSTQKWQNKSFYISKSKHQVGFTSTPSSTDTTDFLFYGPTAMHLGSDNNLQDFWYAVPLDQFERVWMLGWNSTGTQGVVRVSLRSVPPSRPF